jgi:anti-anti-sigma regulatory factor
MTTLTPRPMTIKLAEQFGPVLVGRSNAARIRGQIEDAVHSGQEPVVLDFVDIVTVSPSFADELLAKLDPALREGGRVDVRGMSPALKSIARFMAAGRPRETS